MVTMALADFEVSAAAVAFTVTVGGEGMPAGAVYSPASLIVPQVAPLHPSPERPQFTVVFVE